MTALTVAAIISLSVGLSAAIIGALLTAMMTGEINRKKDDENQIPYFNFPLGKRTGVHSQYRHLYPEGRLHFYIFAASVVMAIGFGGALLCLCLMGVISPPPPSRPPSGGF